MSPVYDVLCISIPEAVPPNKACSQQVGLTAIYGHFPGFGFMLLSSRISSRPSAGNANPWKTIKSLLKNIITNEFTNRPLFFVPLSATVFFVNITQNSKAYVHRIIMYFVEPIRDRKKIAQIKNQLRGQRRYRDLLLFVIGINSILRISDLLQSDHPPTYQARQTGRKTAVQRQKVEELYLAIRSGERR